MTNRKTLVGTLALLAVLIGCGDDDDSAAKDAGPDASDDASRPDSGGSEAGGGGGGKGGKGGTGGGEAGSAGDSGSGGSGGDAGEGTTTYGIGGEVSGLSGSGLVLQNNAGDDLTVDAAGSFSFGTKLESGADYAVTVKTQPQNPAQACTVAMGSGQVGTADVTDVAVTCATNKYTIGGTIAGLTGNGLKLKNNGADELTASGTAFMFATSLDSGAAYAVTISAQPSGQVCGVASGSGNVGGANVSNVAVTCYANPVLAVEPMFGGAKATWTTTGDTTYTLKRTTDGACDLTTMSCPDPMQVASATTPATVTGLMNGTVYYFQLVAAHPGGVNAFSNKTATRPNKPKLDGSVNALATANGVTYAGGAFSRMTVHTGGAVPVHKLTGFPSELPNFPVVDGDVFAVAADGSGGYYIGGAFSAVEDQARAGLAHISSNGTLDTAFAPVVTGIVNTIGVNNNTVYAAGSFTNIGTQMRAGLAAIAPNGDVSMTWNPNPMGGGVSAIAFYHNNVIVGGSFTNIAGMARSSLAMLDGTTGVAQAWDPAADAVVSALAVDGDTIYAAGEFRNIGMAARDRIAALNATGTDIGKATSWNPGADNAVYQLAFANNTVYVAGLFANVGATPTARGGVAAIDAATGAIKPWDAELNPANSVVTLAASGDTAYIAGPFSSVKGMPRINVAALDAAGNLLPWEPSPDGNIESFAFVGESVVMAGQQRGIRGIDRKHLAAFDSNGNVTPWSPSTDNEVHALAVSGTTVYVGGDFGTVSGMPRDNLAAIDTAGTGTLSTTWTPATNGPVYALALTAGSVIAGGSFSMATGQARANLAAFATADPGTATGWDPGASSAVRALAVQGTDVYVGGEFTTLGGSTRNFVGAVGVASNTASTWDPNISGAVGMTSVNALAATADTVYIGGLFTGVGAGPTVRANFAAVSATTPATATAWAPNPDGAVYSLLLAGDDLYVGGDFILVDMPTVNRNHYAVYGGLATTPMLEEGDDFIRNFDLAVRALSPGDSGVIWAAGDFTALGGVYISGVAALHPGG